MTIRVQIEEDVACIEIARPERKNAITVQMYEQLAEALVAAAANKDVRAIVLRGAPTVFCAGNDIHDFLQRPDSAGGAAPRFMKALIELEKPIVAAVNGAAVGIGTTLLMHCDLVYAADDAMFSMPFVSLGICPEFGSSLLVPLAAGYHKAAEKLLFGEPISAEEALEMGLVNRLLPAGEVVEYAMHQARRFRALPSGAVRETKRLLKSGWRAAVQLAMEDELRTLGRLLVSPESREALSAFLERRKPDFARAAQEAKTP
ncbi:MAG TPA: enoyl-CoA hydratase [Burkholderiaceae bacterium]|nr:enoyl-CoA hydratase [Burkholderiaceae bacterium]